MSSDSIVTGWGRFLASVSRPEVQMKQVPADAEYVYTYGDDAASVAWSIGPYESRRFEFIDDLGSIRSFSSEVLMFGAWFARMAYVALRDSEKVAL